MSDDQNQLLAVSYSRDDAARVDVLIDALRARGLSVWFDKDIPGGALWEEIIAKKYRACKALAFFVSHASLASQRCFEEVSTARTLMKPILPILLDPLKLPDELPDRFVLTLQARNGVELHGKSPEASAAAIIEALAAHDIVPGAAPAPSTHAPVKHRTAASRDQRSITPMISLGALALAIVLAGVLYAAGVFGGVAPSAPSAAAPSPVVSTASPAGAEAKPTAPAPSAPAPATPTPAAPPAAAPATPPSQPVETAAAGQPSARLEKQNFFEGERLRVQLLGLPGRDGDAVAIARLGAPDTDTIARQSTERARERVMFFNGLADAGDYELRIFTGAVSGEPVVAARLAFKVVARPDPVLTIAKTSFLVAEPVSVTFSGMPGNDQDWIAISEEGQSETAYVSYVYLKKQTSGSLSLRGLPMPGRYEVRLYFDASGGPERVRQRVYFEVLPRPAPQVAINKTVYAPGEKIEVTFSGMPGNEKDWFCTAREGTGDANYITWTYTKGVTQGTLEVTAPDEPGRYELRARYNEDMGDYNVHARVSFEVQPAP